MNISNKVYDILSLVSRIFVPISAFIASLLVIWQVPYAEQITATLTAVDTLLGGLVMALKVQYDKKMKGEK